MSNVSNAPFDPALNGPLYQQLYTHMRTAILSGELKGGTKLPSTRALADQLHISRNTVLNAYEQLTAEGYIQAVEGSGTFVANLLPDQLLTSPGVHAPRHARPPGPAARQAQFSERAISQLAVPQMFASLPPSHWQSPRPFLVGVPALDAFPYELWSKLVARRARRMTHGTLSYQDSSGYSPLRQAIAAHVAVTRQVHCSPEQIMIVSGSQGALDLASRMLINAGDSVWIEDPGYLGARGALLGAGARVIPVRVDEEGLDVEAGIAHAPQARLVYLTPSHQFPLGVTMSLRRRLALLDWAKCADAYLLEDDYDSEYRFAGRPLAALQGLDDADRVIYIGTFSKVLFPSLRIGYLILPRPLVDAFLAVRNFSDIHTSVLEQAALADFMTEGHFERHLRRMCALYAERRAALLQAVKELPLEIHSSEAGIHCLGWLPKGWDDVSLADKAAAQNITLVPVSKLCIEPLTRRGFVLGYGAFNARQIKDAVRRLATVMREAHKAHKRP